MDTTERPPGRGPLANDDCDCGYPQRRYRSGSGHDPYCPQHEKWEQQLAQPQP
jgi:hypothetical protein